MSICSFYQLGRKRQEKKRPRKFQILIALLLIFAVLCIPISTGVRALGPTLILNPNYGLENTDFTITLAGSGYPTDGDCVSGLASLKEGVPFAMQVGPMMCNIASGELSGAIPLLLGNPAGTYTILVQALGSAQLFLYPSITTTKTQTTTTTATASTDTTVTATHTDTSETTIGSTVTTTTTEPTTFLITTTVMTTTSGVQTIYTSVTLAVLTSYQWTTTAYGTTTTFFPIGTTTSYGLTTQTVYTAVTPETVTNTHTATQQYYTTVGGTSTQWTTTSANTTEYLTETATQTFTEETDVTATVTVATVTVTGTEQAPAPGQDMTGIYILAGIIIVCVAIGCLWYLEMLPEMPDFISDIPERLSGIFRRKKPPEEEEAIEEPPSSPEPIQCSNCQTINEAKTIYCIECGNKLGAPRKPEEPKESKETEPPKS